MSAMSITSKKTCDTCDLHWWVSRWCVMLFSMLLFQCSDRLDAVLYLHAELCELCLSQSCKLHYEGTVKEQERRWVLFVAMHSAHLCHNNSSGWWSVQGKRIRLPGALCRPLPSKRDRPQVQTAQLISMLWHSLTLTVIAPTYGTMIHSAACEMADFYS